MYWIAAGLIAAAFLLYFAADSLAQAVLRLARGEMLREDLPAPTGTFKNEYDQTDLWARNHGFHAAGLTRVSLFPDMAELKPDHPAIWEHLAAWKNRRTKQMLVLQAHNGRAFHHLITLYRSASGERTMVNTTDYPGEFSMPQPPGHHVQSFPGKSPGELYELHLRAESWLEAGGGWQREDAPLPLEELDRLTRERARYVSSLPYWKPRLLVWSLLKGAALNRPLGERPA